MEMTKDVAKAAHIHRLKFRLDIQGEPIEAQRVL